jgi:hypothetical protein
VDIVRRAGLRHRYAVNRLPPEASASRNSQDRRGGRDLDGQDLLRARQSGPPTTRSGRVIQRHRDTSLRRVPRGQRVPARAGKYQRVPLRLTSGASDSNQRPQPCESVLGLSESNKAAMTTLDRYRSNKP